MATSAEVIATCKELSDQIRAQTEFMRGLAAASARLAPTQAPGAHTGRSTSRPASVPTAPRPERMGEVSGPATTPDAQLSTTDLLRVYGVASLAARGWLPGEQR
jgi:hypothetical protein